MGTGFWYDTYDRFYLPSRCSREASAHQRCRDELPSMSRSRRLSSTTKSAVSSCRPESSDSDTVSSLGLTSPLLVALSAMRRERLAAIIAFSFLQGAIFISGQLEGGHWSSLSDGKWVSRLTLQRHKDANARREKRSLKVSLYLGVNPSACLLLSTHHNKRSIHNDH